MMQRVALGQYRRPVAMALLALGASCATTADEEGDAWRPPVDAGLEAVGRCAPGLASADEVGGPAYVLPGLAFLGAFTPTFSSYTTFGASFSLQAISCDATGGLARAPWILAGYQPHQGAFSVAATVGVASVSQYTGLWMFRVPEVPCAADLDGNGFVDGADLTALLGAWNSAKSPADLNADGFVDAADMAVLLNSWGQCQ